MSDDGPRRTMQPAINNPLPALMAEIQLLQRKDPSPANSAVSPNSPDPPLRHGGKRPILKG